jgi:hypothetical protein
MSEISLLQKAKDPKTRGCWTLLKVALADESILKQFRLIGRLRFGATTARASFAVKSHEDRSH